MLTHTHTHAHAQTNKQGITNTSNQLTNRLSGSGQDEILYIQDVTSLQNTAVPLADRLWDHFCGWLDRNCFGDEALPVWTWLGWWSGPEWEPEAWFTIEHSDRVPKFMSFGKQPDGCPDQPRGQGLAGQGHKVTGLWVWVHCLSVTVLP